MQPPPRTPVQPLASTPGRDKPSSLLSPSYSRRAFPATASASASAVGDQDASVFERPCVTMFEWWLARVEEDDQKIAVGGLFERNQTVQEFAPSAIAKRHKPCVVETEDGIVIVIRGSLNIPQTIANGYSSKVCEKFMIGFPSWWQSLNLLYPKATSTSNSEVDSTRFYLEKFQLGQRFHSHGLSLLSKLLNSVRSSSRNDAAFQKSSHLPNGAPRFEEDTGDGDIATNENAAASNDDVERHEAACNEVVNSVETSLIVGSTIRERGHDNITTNVSLAPTVECTNDAVNEGVDNTSLLGCKTNPVASLKSQLCQERHQHIPSNEKPSGLPKKQRSSLQRLQGPTRSQLTSPVPYAHDSPLTRGRATSLSMSTPESLKLGKTRSGRVVVPTLDAGCQRIVYDTDGTITGVVGLDSPSPKGSKLKTYARGKKRAEPPAASKLKTYARRKKSAE